MSLRFFNSFRSVLEFLGVILFLIFPGIQMDGSKYRKQSHKVDKCIVSKNKKRVKMKRTDRMNKKKRSIQKINGGQYQGGKIIANRRLTSGRLKPKQHHDGLFLKGLRTRYVKRIALNVADEARRKEDINRIIDLGKLIDGIPPTENDRCDSPEVRKKKKIPESGKVPSSVESEKNSPRENSMDLDACNLSPISFSRSPVFCPSFETRWTMSIPICTNIRERKKEYTFELNFVEEFRKFASDLEDYSGSEILLRLPQDGVLEAAMKSLRSLYMSHQESIENVNSEEELDEGEDGFDEVGFFPTAEHLERNNFESVTNEVEASIMDALISGKERGITELGDLGEVMPIMNMSPVENDYGPNFMDFDINNHISNQSFSSLYCASGSDYLTSLFDNGTYEANNWPGKEIEFDTPPIQFYRRNMF